MRISEIIKSFNFNIETYEYRNALQSNRFLLVASEYEALTLGVANDLVRYAKALKIALYAKENIADKKEEYLQELEKQSQEYLDKMLEAAHISKYWDELKQLEDRFKDLETKYKEKQNNSESNDSGEESSS